MNKSDPPPCATCLVSYGFINSYPVPATIAPRTSDHRQLVLDLYNGLDLLSSSPEPAAPVYSALLNATNPTCSTPTSAASACALESCRSK